MLVIRRGQLAAFDVCVRDAYVAMLCRTLREQLGDAVCGADDAALEARVARALASATRHGFVAPSDVYRFAREWLLVGDGFDERPEPRWLRECFDDPELAPEARMTRFEYHRYVLGRPLAP